MAEVTDNSLVGSDNSHISAGLKTDSDEGYSGYRLDEDWDEGQKTIMDMGPLHIDNDMLGHDALDIPSPTFPCVSSSVATTDYITLDQHCRDLQDTTAAPGVAGLCNLGNTCFMNSGLQCLLSHDRLVQYFVEEFNEKDDDLAKHTLAGNFARLLHRFWHGGFSQLHPGDFKNSVGIYHPQFSDHRQHDCQEFLALLLDSLHEYLNQQSILKPNNSCANNELSPLSGCQESEQPDFGTLYLDSDHSVPVGDLVQSGSVSRENQDDSVGTEEGRSFDFSELAKKKCEDKSFSIVTNSAFEAGSSSDGSTDLKGSETVTRPEEGKDVLMELDDDNFHRKIPSIDDFCSKDTKTLNTNVLVPTDDAADLLATDSVKFHKQDNASIIADEDDVEDDSTPGVIDSGQLHDLFMAACASKPVKETNLMANCHEKFSDSQKISLAASLWDQNAVIASSKECFAVDGMKRFLDREPLESLYAKYRITTDEDKPEDINNIKRIKIDDMAAEKNMRMQAKLKVNVEQNPTRITAQSSVGSPNIFSGFGDQLCSSPLSTASSASVSDSASLLQPEASTSASVCGTVEGLLQMQYVRSAERAWQAYTSRNQSIIVNTFQGQFKSTVICSECRHVSVTFEPFMYLSVPIPHALERQFSVVFIPCDSKQPVRYLVSVHQLNLVRHLRAELIRMVGEDETCDLVIAEVLDHHVARILEDSMQVKMVNDTDRLIYAFEMLPMPIVETLAEDVVNQSETPEANAAVTLANNAASLSYVNGSAPPDNLYVLDDIVMILSGSDAPGVEVPVDNVLNNSIEPSIILSAGTESVVTHLESNPDVDWQHNVLNDATVVNAVTSEQPSTSNTLWQDESGNCMGMKTTCDGDYLTLNGAAGSWSHEGDGGFPFNEENLDSLGEFHGGCPSGETKTVADDCTTSADALGVEKEDELACVCVADQWKSCVICLEEMADSDLKAHASCGGTLCHNCLEMSTKHLGNPFSKCPVCTAPVTPDDDFIPLSCMENYKPKTRILSVPVVFRYVCTESASSSSSASVGKDAVIRFGHPNVLYLPNKLSGSLLYETVDRIVPLLANYSIVLTNGQGSRCSRCLYTQHCTGCELHREATEVVLQPGDHLAVQFGELTREQMETASRFVDHPSMETLRPNTAMTLYDCFKAFTESEVLDEHNPWFCPQCRKNQCASKTMSVWRYPDTLIVYLKRFVYHELSSTKIDNKVVFPLESLDLSSYISGPRSSDLIYDLQSCVLHFGGVNSGHYTAYARHPLSNDWLYTNDETVVKQLPSDADYSHVYILFYQRRGTQVNFSLPPKCSPDNDEVCAEDSDDVKIRPLAPISPAAASSASSSHCGPDDLTTTISGDEQTCKGGDSCT